MRLRSRFQRRGRLLDEWELLACALGGSYFIIGVAGLVAFFLFSIWCYGGRVSGQTGNTHGIVQ